MADKLHLFMVITVFCFVFHGKLSTTIKIHKCFVKQLQYAIAGFFAYLVARTTLWMNQSHIKFSDLKCKILLDFTGLPSFKDVLSSLKQNIYISNKPSAFFIKGLWTLDSNFVVLSRDPTKPHLIKGIDQTNNTGKQLLSKNRRFSWTCFKDIDKLKWWCFKCLLSLKNTALSTQKIKSLKEINGIQEVKILCSERYLTGIECEEVFKISLISL